MRALGACEQTIGRAGLRVGFKGVGERKEIDRIEDVEELQRVARRLPEAVVERSAPRAADLIEHAVEHAPSLFVRVEPLIQKMPEKPAALRHAPADGDGRARDRIRG